MRTLGFCAVLSATLLVSVGAVTVNGSLTNGLILHYSFDTRSGTTVTDQSGTGNHGTVQGDPHLVPGVLGNCYEFDGVDDSIERAYADSIGLHPTTPPFSFSTWFKTAANQPLEPSIVSTHYAGAGADGYRIVERWGGTTQLHYVVNYIAGIDYAATVNDGAWHHIVGVCGVSLTSLYLDGVLVGSMSSQPGTIPYVSRPSFKIAHSPNNNASWARSSFYYFNGCIDEFRFYNRELLEEDVTELYRQTNAPLAVTVNQAEDQVDPTSVSPINFTAVFSKPVADFAVGDVTITGTAPGTKTATVAGSGATYNVAVSGMTGSGTVIATIEAGKVHDAAGNANAASTSTDNSVTYVVTRVISLSGDMAFGNVLVGLTFSRMLTVGNLGNSALHVTSITCPAGFSASPQSFTVAAAGSQSVTVTFAPTEMKTYSGTLSVNSDKTSGISAIACSGSGVPGYWSLAYKVAFTNSSDVALLRRYRDEILLGDPDGSKALEWLYAQSEKALSLMLRDPELCRACGELVNVNRAAITNALAGGVGEIADATGVLEFLEEVRRSDTGYVGELAALAQHRVLGAWESGEPLVGFVFGRPGDRVTVGAAARTPGALALRQWQRWLAVHRASQPSGPGKRPRLER